MSATTSYGMTLTLPSGVTGIITDGSLGYEPQRALEYNSKGAVIGDVIYDKKYTASITAQVPATATLNEGDKISIDGTEFMITSCTITESNRDFRKWSLQGEAYNIGE